MMKNYMFSGKVYPVRIEKDGDSYRAECGERKHRIENFMVTANTITMDFDGRRYTVYVADAKDRQHVAVDGEFFQFENDTSQEHKSKGTVGAKGDNVVSQMPGLLVKVPVSVGDKVTSGTTLAIVEAMKMQTELRSPSDGLVKKINFKEGQQIDAFVPIVELEI